MILSEFTNLLFIPEKFHTNISMFKASTLKSNLLSKSSFKYLIESNNFLIFGLTLISTSSFWFKIFIYICNFYFFKDNGLISS